MKVAVITPYLDEPDELILECHDSVMSQSMAATHIMIADGKPSAVVGALNASHIILDKPHSDGGDTPRAIGATCALSEGFDAVAFLDADNWLHQEHIASCITTALERNVPVVFSDRQIVLSTGEICNFDDLDSALRLHVDTSCFFMTKEVAFLWALWGKIPQKLSGACDRLLLAAIRARGIGHEWTNKRTVYYRSYWGMHFRALGLDPPADEHMINWPNILENYDADELVRRFGFDPEFDLSTCSNKFRANPSDAHDYQSRLRFFD